MFNVHYSPSLALSPGLANIAVFCKCFDMSRDIENGINETDDKDNPSSPLIPVSFKQEPTEAVTTVP